jgi:hypothetical protein
MSFPDRSAGGDDGRSGEPGQYRFDNQRGQCRGGGIGGTGLIGTTKGNGGNGGKGGALFVNDGPDGVT